uniref:sensor histidine kinase n=1 Tax=uncultured Flavobacterium sp. TaxID=165435 RepID=UPI00292CC5EE
INIQNIYKINLYRILQEAILNINKYANAKNCDVKIEQQDTDSLKMSVVDDGQGFDINNIKTGIGLINMYERTESLGGHFHIKSKIGIGTKIEVTLNFLDSNLSKIVE